MGIRFRCHHCEYELHVKDFQAGRRGRCPECGGKFRIPQQDASRSISLNADVPKALNATEPTEGKGTGKGKVESQASHDSAEPPPSSPKPSTPKSSTPKPSTSKPSTSKPSRPHTGEAQVASLPEVNTQTVASAEAALPVALTSAPEATWYVRPTSGGQYGPAPSETFVQWLVEGRICRDALVWRDGWPDWLAGAQAFPDYFSPELSDELPSQLAHSVPGNSPTLPTPSPTPGAAPVAISMGDRNRIGRKQRKRRRYIVFLSVLTVLFIGLITALVIVLLQQT